MEGKGRISQYRARLDKTLASPELTNGETLKTLVRNQLLHSSQDGIGGCSESVVEKKTEEVSKFLDMLRSASVNDNEVSKASDGSHGQWKLKQDNEEFRVMYREGPQGTPLHSLLVEGYVEGPLDACKVYVSLGSRPSTKNANALDMQVCVMIGIHIYSEVQLNGRNIYVYSDTNASVKSLLDMGNVDEMKSWWPQYNFPPFKVTSCKCLQKVRISEEISLVRVKVTWPLSAREALLHYFMFEFFQDDLIVILMNTIDDVKSIDRNTHGFTSDGIPEAKDVVRIDLVGGFALQKVTRERSYFRTIAHMDVKLDFVPPSLINFISRQLIGSGFRLYQKAVASVCNRGEDYREALEKPLYAQIREALYSTDESKEALKGKELKNNVRSLPEECVSEGMPEGLVDMEQDIHNNNNASECLLNNELVTDRRVVSEFALKASELRNDACILPEEDHIKGIQYGMNKIEQNVHNINHACESLPNNAQLTESKAIIEIEEEESEESIHIEEDDYGVDQSLPNEIPGKCHVNGKRDVFISTSVVQALATLEKAIYMVREYGFNGQTRSSFGLTNGKPPTIEMDDRKDSNSSEGDVCTNLKESKKETTEKTYHESRKCTGIQDVRLAGSNSYIMEVNHNRIAPASPEGDLLNTGKTNQVSLSSSQNGTTAAPILDRTMHATNKQKSTEANGIHENTFKGRKKLSRRKHHRFCCFFAHNPA